MLPNLYGKNDLKPREQKIIGLVTQGLKNAEIARAIGTTEPMVKNYIRGIYDKLGMWNRVELALWHISRRQNTSAKYKAS
jgi:DNA-binding NarL/FixJ family response regulator